MAKVVLLDDEQHCTDILKSLIQKNSTEYQIVALFNNPIEALGYIKNSEFDILFLDIQMPEMNGFQLLDQLDSIDFDIIFTTAYDQYAINAFNYSAFNYLLKPITEKALTQALHLWEQRKRKIKSGQWQLFKNRVSGEASDSDKIALPTQTGYEIINIQKIIRCQSENNYTTFFCENGVRILICRTLKQVEEILPDTQFFRVHQSHIINSKFIRSVTKRDGGILIMEDDSEIPVSRSKRTQIDLFIERLASFK